MTIHDILNDIDAEKQKALAELETELAKKIAELDTNQEKRMEGLKEDYRIRVEKKALSIEKKLQAQTNMESKTLLLSAKRNSLNAAFEQAIKSLAGAANYTETLAKLLSQVDLDEATIIAAKGKKPETINALKKAGKNYKIVSEGEFIGGVIVIGSDVEIDLSFETLVDELRGDLETDIAFKLFK